MDISREAAMLLCCYYSGIADHALQVAADLSLGSLPLRWDYGKTDLDYH